MRSLKLCRGVPAPYTQREPTTAAVSGAAADRSGKLRDHSTRKWANRAAELVTIFGRHLPVLRSRYATNSRRDPAGNQRTDHQVFRVPLPASATFDDAQMEQHGVSTHQGTVEMAPTFPGFGLALTARVGERIKISDVQLGAWPNGLNQQPTSGESVRLARCYSLTI